MSDLQRSFAKAQLSRLPPEPALIFDEREEENLDDLGPSSVSSNDSSSSASSTGTIKPAPDRKLFGIPGPPNSNKIRFSPLQWHEFFSQELFLDRQTPSGFLRYHVYLTPQSGTGPLFVTHHGAGSSGLSFAVVNKEIQRLIPDAGMLSLDARGHGSTTDDTISENERTGSDLSLSTLANDLVFVVNSVKQKVGWSSLPDVVLVGHSLGGAVVTEVAHQKALGNCLLGYAVLDVVEGSAIDALQSMESYLSTRPRSFPSLSSGIEWHVRSRTIRNNTSAQVSVPSLLKEEAEHTWVWRTDLGATKPYWENWFTGLSQKFLESRGGKLLILAGTDRLDKELMIGQMQGKYQLQVFPDAGHFVHEDQPERTAQVIADFYKRNDRSSLVLPPKVSELIQQGKLKAAAPK